jgi:xylulokinase
VARLTGEFVTDVSDASGMNLFNLEKGAWSDRLLQAAEIKPGQLPEVRRSTDVVGRVQPNVAEEAGLVGGTPVIIGAGDGACATVGAGVVEEGTAYNYIGSSSWIGISSRKPIYDPDLRTFTFAHAVPAMYAPLGTMQAAGASYQWSRDQLCSPEVQAAEALGVSAYEMMNQKASSSPTGANGLIFLPYLLGERSPRWNPKARGSFIGLTFRHTRADMICAVLEGVSLNLRVILEAFRAQGANFDNIRLIGGGARGRFWCQMLADVYGLPIHRLDILEEATSMGAAVIGGVGIGLYPDFSMSQSMNPVVEVFTPDRTNQATYEQMADVFEASYQALVPVYDMMAENTS